MIPKFAFEWAAGTCELRNRDTSLLCGARGHRSRFGLSVPPRRPRTGPLLEAATGGKVFVQNSATTTDDHGVAAAPEAAAAGKAAHRRMTRLCRTRPGHAR